MDKLDLEKHILFLEAKIKLLMVWSISWSIKWYSISQIKV